MYKYLFSFLGYSITENNVAECNNWNRKSKTYLGQYSALTQASNKFIKSSVLEYSFEEVSAVKL